MKRLVQVSGYLLYFSTLATGHNQIPQILGDPISEFKRDDSGVWKNGNTSYFCLEDQSATVSAQTGSTGEEHNPFQSVPEDINPEMYAKDNENFLTILRPNAARLDFLLEDSGDYTATLPGAVRRSILQKLKNIPSENIPEIIPKWPPSDP